MSDNQDTTRDQPGSNPPVEQGGEGIEITSGEPNTFEPEEDPDAAADTD